MALEIVQRINTLLPSGYPYTVDFAGNKLLAPGVGAAKIWEVEGSSVKPHRAKLLRTVVNIGVTERQSTAARSSSRTFKSCGKLFLDWATSEGIADLPVREFTKRHAVLYMDYWSGRNVKNTTWNNKLQFISSVFTELVKRDYFDVNPFGGIKRRKKNKTTKSGFRPPEIKILQTHFKQRHRGVFLTSNLAFWGLVRQEEMAKMKIENIDIANSVLRLDATVSKTDFHRNASIPRWLCDELAVWVEGKDPEMYAFGAGFTCAYDMIGERTMNTQHQILKRELIEKGMLDARPGLSFSSWRKSGMNYLAKILKPREHQEQSGHRNLATTQIYFEDAEFNPKIISLENPFL